MCTWGRRGAAQPPRPTPPVKVTPWDGPGMKRAMDEAVAAQLDKQCGVSTNYTYNNWKLVIMVVSVIVGCVAQFAPIPFPKSRLLLAGCVAAYFALSGVYQYLAWYVDRDCIWTSKAKEASGEVHVRSVMPRYSDKVVLIVEAPWKREVFRTEHGVGEFFTEAGVLSAGRVVKLVQQELLSSVKDAAAKKRL